MTSLASRLFGGIGEAPSTSDSAREIVFTGSGHGGVFDWRLATQAEIDAILNR